MTTFYPAIPVGELYTLNDTFYVSRFQSIVWVMYTRHPSSLDEKADYALVLEQPKTPMERIRVLLSNGQVALADPASLVDHASIV